MKDCLIIGFPTAMHYKVVFDLVVDKTLMITERTVHFYNEEGNEEGGTSKWYSTMRWVPDNRIKLTKTYNEKDYPKYDNYDAIECKYKDNIPIDYKGKIGVPTSFFFYYPELDYEVLEHRGDLKLNGKTVYERLIIRRKK